MIIRPYTPADEPACLAIFDGNTPDFFAPEEHGEFAEYLREPGEAILVAEDSNGSVVGVGGYYLRHVGIDDRTARTVEGGLAWGMVDRAHQRHGIGAELLRARLDALRHAGATSVSVRTSQHSRGFFERAGFVVARELRDGFAPGIDLVELQRSILPDAHQ